MTLNLYSKVRIWTDERKVYLNKSTAVRKSKLYDDSFSVVRKNWSKKDA